MRFSILKNTRNWFAISAVLTVISFFFLFAPGFGLPLGIDFTGGTELEISFSNSMPSKEKIIEIFNTSVASDRGLRVIEESNSQKFLFPTIDLCLMEHF